MKLQHNLQLGWQYPASKITEECIRAFDKISICMLYFLGDENFTFLWANKFFYFCSGKTKAEFQEQFQNLRQCFENYPEAFENLKEQILEAVKEGEADEDGKNINLTAVFPLREELCRVKISAEPAGEKIDGYPVIRLLLMDVSDIAGQSNEENRQLEERSHYFEWMMDAYVGNVYISDMTAYDLLYMNKTACATLGMKQEEVIGKKCYEVIQGRTAPCDFCTNAFLTEKEFYEWEFYNPVLERSFMIKNRIVNWKGHRARIELSHDMYSTEYQLAKKDREREALIRTIPGGFARIDARDCTTVLWYGASFLQIIGYTEEQFKTELHSRCAYMLPEDTKRRMELMDDVRRTGQSAVYEARIITYGGEIKILAITLCYVSGEDSWDGIPSFYSVGIDVTKGREEQVRQKKALEEAYRVARMANSAKTDFLSSMSHDIRTPMNAIMGMTTIAQANLDSAEKVEDCLKKINISSAHLLNLLNEVLDMSKIESGKINLAAEEIELPKLIEDVADMCRPLILERNQKFQISAGLIRHEKIITDGERLKQVFMNIISNAVKYTPEGGSISFRINELPSLIPDTGQFEFIFTDNGIGMSEEFIRHIFEPFSRAEDSRISKIQGTGLGMAITDNIVQMMNGAIEVKSRLGKGSRFTVSIPFGVGQEEKACGNELAGLSVLIVDDNKAIYKDAAAILKELGIQSSWALTGTEGIRRTENVHLTGQDYFALILDAGMPGEDSLNTLRSLRKKAEIKVPVVVVSAFDNVDIREDFLKAGADAFITLPLFQSKILHALQKFHSEGERELPPAKEEKRPALQGVHILLAEDNELNREITVELFKMRGIIADAVENGRQAVDAFKAAAPGYYDAVLLDIQMPVMNGYDAAAEIRALGRSDAGTIPIIALTANAFTSDISKSRSVGMNEHISKPIDMDRLSEALQNLIG